MNSGNTNITRNPMRLSKTAGGPLLERHDEFLVLAESWDDLFRRDELKKYLSECTGGVSLDGKHHTPLAPISSQEVWAAGITYFASRDARMEEAATENNADVYERCYNAERPELFMKATPHRVVGPGDLVRIRRDSAWNVPEPELTIAMTAHGEVLGYTIGNDMSSRDIEGDNPLYLPQAKIYDGCAALGPSILVVDAPPDPSSEIALVIERPSAPEPPDSMADGVADELRSVTEVFRGATTVSQIRRTFDDLIAYLWRHCTFPNGCFLMTGTGIVPPAPFTLEPGDRVSISIEGIGTLTNTVARS